MSSDRASNRLEIARKLLGLPIGSDVMAAIKVLTKEARDSLKSQTDWVEEYENYVPNTGTQL